MSSEIRDSEKASTASVACVAFFTICTIAFLTGCWMVIREWQRQDFIGLLYALIVALVPLVVALIGVIVIVLRR